MDEIDKIKMNVAIKKAATSILYTTKQIFLKEILKSPLNTVNIRKKRVIKIFDIKEKSMIKRLKMKLYQQQ
jgi:hypothetical protein